MFNKQDSDVMDDESKENTSEKSFPKSVKVAPSGRELSFKENEVLVSKTDLKGKIKYVNDVFIDISGYSEAELMGASHNIVRHPEMPRAVYHLLWDRLADDKHVFAYVVNLCKNGDHYWVLAHICPSFDADGNVMGYHSSRRKADMSIVNGTIKPLYKQLLDIEANESSKRVGLEKSVAAFDEVFEAKGIKYNEYILSL